MFGMKHKYNTVKNTIENDRESGYKNSQYAVAELIDNSIQAGLKKKNKKKCRRRSWLCS